MTTAQTLELVNNVRTINQAAIFLYLSWFMIWGLWSTPYPQQAMMPNARGLAMCLAFALWMHQAGGLVIGITVWLFRAVGIGGGAGAASVNTLPGMILGSVLISISAVLLLRIMSIAKFGNVLWAGLVAIDFIYMLYYLVH